MQNKKMKIIPILFLLTSIVLGSCAAESEQKPESVDETTLHITQIDTSEFPLIRVYLSALDENDQPVAVPVSSIELLEDGKPVEAQSIQGMDQVSSFTSVLLIDNSGSMNFSDKLDSAKIAATDYVNQMRPSDLAGVITFNTQTKVVQEITSDKELLNTGISNIQARDDTAMWDAMQAAVDILNPLQGRKAIILMTDGMDNQSKTTPEDVLASIGETGLSISTIGFGLKPEGEDDPDLYEGIDEITLSSIANQAGGIYGYAEDVATLSSLYTTIREALQSEVVITYVTPLTLRDGVNRGLSAKLSGNWQNQVSGSSTKYNPGGLIPEIPDPENWTMFLILAGTLLLLLLLPLIFIQWKSKSKKKKKIRIVLKD